MIPACPRSHVLVLAVLLTALAACRQRRLAGRGSGGCGGCGRDGQAARLAPGSTGSRLRAQFHAPAADPLGLGHVVRGGQGTGRPLGLCRRVLRLREREGRRRGAGQSQRPQRPVPGAGRRQPAEVQAGRPGGPPVSQGHAAGGVSPRRPGQLPGRQVEREEPQSRDAGSLFEAGRTNQRRGDRQAPHPLPGRHHPERRRVRAERHRLGQDVLGARSRGWSRPRAN